MSFVATFVHFVDAVRLAAHVDESGLLADGLLDERLPAEAAFEGNTMGLCFFAIHADVVGLFLA
jgi:hypothetical protein